MLKLRLESTRGVLAGLALAAASSTPALGQALKIGGTGAALGTMQLLAQAYAKGQPEARITVLPSMGSGGGIKAVLAGAAQIAVSSRPLNEAETQAGAVAFEYGRTPLVFATPAGSKVAEISRQGLIDIYAGKVTAWPDGTPLRLVLRPIGDSDSEAIKRLSPDMQQAKSAAEQRKGMVFTVTDQETATSIEKTPGALGPSTLALMLSERRALKALALDGVAPTVANMANGSYPLQKQMLVVTGPKSPPEAQAFIAFLHSSAGREILQQTGHWTK